MEPGEQLSGGHFSVSELAGFPPNYVLRICNAGAGSEIGRLYKHEDEGGWYIATVRKYDIKPGINIEQLIQTIARAKRAPQNSYFQQQVEDALQQPFRIICAGYEQERGNCDIRNLQEFFRACLCGPEDAGLAEQLDNFIIGRPSPVGTMKMKVALDKQFEICIMGLQGEIDEDLLVRNTGLRLLPSGLRLHGNLDIRGTEIHELPEDMQIDEGKEIYVDARQMGDMEASVPAHLRNKLVVRSESIDSGKTVGGASENLSSLSSVLPTPVVLKPGTPVSWREK